jgi:hypothetical protein
MRRVSIVLFQQLVFEQLKETDVDTCIRQDATLQAAGRTQGSRREKGGTGYTYRG